MTKEAKKKDIVAVRVKILDGNTGEILREMTCAEHDIELNVGEGEVWEPYTEGEIAREPEQPKLTLDELDARMRTKRDEYLMKSDWTRNPERAMSKELSDAWKEYRAQLFDITKQEGWPLVIQWPELPKTKEITNESITRKA